MPMSKALALPGEVENAKTCAFKESAKDRCVPERSFTGAYLNPRDVSCSVPAPGTGHVRVAGGLPGAETSLGSTAEEKGQRRPLRPQDHQSAHPLGTVLPCVWVRL